MSALAIRAVKRWLASEGLPSGAPCCQGCNAEIAPEHAHVVDLTIRSFLCVCEWCSVALPVRPGSSYRMIPERSLRLPADTLTEPEWDELQIPVGIAFFFKNSVLGSVIACYPSPAGPVESQLPLDDAHWIRTLTPDVEALLVRRTHRANESFLVPIDVAYQLVGLIRREWKGLGGGADVERAIDGFFAKLDQMSGGALA